MYCNHPEHVLTWNETEVGKMFRTFRKCGIDILPDVEKNFQLMVSEAQIRYQTHRQLGEMHSAKVEDFVRWQYRQSEKGCSRIHPQLMHQMPKVWPKVG
jgi:hypothetical protein